MPKRVGRGRYVFGHGCGSGLVAARTSPTSSFHSHSSEVLFGVVRTVNAFEETGERILQASGSFS